MTSKTCVLKGIDNDHDPIALADNTPVTLGRGPLTKIKDSRCSRTQVLLLADYSKQIIRVTQLGRNPCGLNGEQLTKDVPVEAKHGDKLDLLFGQFKHVFEFQQSPDTSNKASDSNKTVNEISDSGEDEDDQPLAKQPKLSNSEKTYVIREKCWKSVDKGQLLIYTPPESKPQMKVAAYDLDHTIITTTSGGTFPKNYEDWHIMYPEIKTKLKSLHNSGYKVVIFTNQGGLHMHTTPLGFKHKIEQIVDKLGIPVQVFIASGGNSKYRKPCPCMWYKFIEDNGEVDLNESFFCGDAAGREAGAGRSKPDFSQSDYLFSKNLGIKFMTPEEHFLGKKSMPPRITAFDPSSISFDTPLCDPEWGQIHSVRPELVLLVGSPGSGKSHFARVHLIPQGYVHINRDTLGKMAKCIQDVETALIAKKHVVVDNTNPTKESRSKFISLAKRYGVPARAFVMKTSLEHAKHNLKFRRLTDPSHADISDAVLRSYCHAYEEPSLSEGISEVLKINFWVARLSPENKKLYNMFLTEK